MTTIVREIYAYRELLVALTARDIRVRYKQAVMGLAWAFFLPMLAVAAGAVIQVALAHLQGKDLLFRDIASVMVRAIPWMMFTQILSNCSNGLLSNMSLASKIYFPRQVIPLSSTLSVLFDIAIGASLVAVLLIVLPGSPLVWTPWLLMLPVIAVILVLMGLGLGLLFGSANLFFRDVKYILAIVLQFGVFFSAVYVFREQMGRLGEWLMWNPVVPCLESIAMIVTEGRLTGELGWFLAYSAAFAAASFVVGLIVFRRSEHLFAEVM